MMQEKQQEPCSDQIFLIWDRIVLLVVGFGYLISLHGLMTPCTEKSRNREKFIMSPQLKKKMDTSKEIVDGIMRGNFTRKREH